LTETETAQVQFGLMGKIINITEPDGTNIKYDYDYAGNLVSTTDGNGNTTRYTYNSLNLLSEIIILTEGK